MCLRRGRSQALARWSKGARSFVPEDLTIAQIELVAPARQCGVQLAVVRG
jgi:hypothetical protein